MAYPMPVDLPKAKARLGSPVGPPADPDPSWWIHECLLRRQDGFMYGGVREQLAAYAVRVTVGSMMAAVDGATVATEPVSELLWAAELDT